MAKLKTFNQAIDEEIKLDAEQMSALFVEWREKLEYAKAARAAWDETYTTCDRILSNDIPTFKPDFID